MDCDRGSQPVGRFTLDDGFEIPSFSPRFYFPWKGKSSDKNLSTGRSIGPAWLTAIPRIWRSQGRCSVPAITPEPPARYNGDLQGILLRSSKGLNRQDTDIDARMVTRKNPCADWDRLFRVTTSRYQGSGALQSRWILPVVHCGQTPRSTIDDGLNNPQRVSL